MTTPTTERDRTAPPEGELWLVAPDWRALDTIAQREDPWVLWRIGSQSLLAHWMDEAVRRNVARVHLVCADRMAEIEASLNGGLYWSRELEFHAALPVGGADADHVETLVGLPGLPAPQAPTDGPSLLRHWLDLQLAWLNTRSATVSVDRQLHPLVWVGPGVRIHPSARLTGPCWIGARTEIGADAEIGPHAIVGHQSVIDQNASVAHSVVLPETFVGSRLHLQRMMADGATLLDANRGTRVDISDSFMLARLRSTWGGWFGKRKQRS